MTDTPAPTVARAQRISRTCWQCHEPVAGPVCASCGRIQPPPAEADFFAQLGLERRYFLDTAELEARWRGVSRQVHPDKFARRPAVERRMSLQWTASINEARRVLKDPIARARYLASGRTAPPEEGGPKLDPDFLEAVFDLQERLADDPDAARARAAAMREELQAELTALFTRWEAGSGGLEAVEGLLARLKYVTNILGV